MENRYESYWVVKFNDESWGKLHGDDIVDDPAWDYSKGGDDGLVYPFQVVGEHYIDATRETWYEVVAGFHNEGHAKRYIECLERADLLRAHINNSLISKLENIQKEDKQ